MSTDERLLASAAHDGTVQVWDRLNRTRTYSLQTGSPGALFGLTFEPQGHRIVWATAKCLGTIDLRTGRTNTIPIEGNRGLLMGISVSPDNQEIIFGSSTNVMICELPTMRLHPFVSCDEEVYAIAYTPDGRLLAFGYASGTVSLWDREGGCKLPGTEAHTLGLSSFEFSPDGKLLAIGGRLDISLWHVQSNGLTPSKTLLGHAGYVPAIAFSPDGKRLVSASSDNTLKLWDTAEGIELGTLYGHRGGRLWRGIFKGRPANLFHRRGR